MTRRITSDTGPCAIVPIWILDAVATREISARAFMVYSVLSFFEWSGDTPARTALASRIDVSVDTIDRAIEDLIRIGAVEVGRDGRTRTYQIRRAHPPNRNAAARADIGSRGSAASTGVPSRESAASTEDRALYLNLETDFRDTPPPPTGSVAVEPSKGLRGAERIVFEAWVRSTGKKRSVLDDKRRRLIRAQLDGYTVEELCLAVTGWQFSPHHRGENDRGTVYNSLSLILRDAEHVDQFLEYARCGNGGGRVTSGRDPLSGVREFLADRAEQHSFVGEIGNG